MLKLVAATAVGITVGEPAVVLVQVKLGVYWLMLLTLPAAICS